MSTTIHQSNAFLTFVDGDHLKDLQILVDNPQLFNILPGKSERKGVKTLSSWPVFVTLVLNQGQLPADHSEASASVSMALREASPDYRGFDIFDMTTTAYPTGLKAHKRQIAKTLAEIRKLHEDLNAQLYARPTERPVVHSPREAFDLLQPFLGPLDHEELWVMNLDTRNRVMNLVRLYQGSVNQSQVRIGEVFRQALVDNAPAIVVTHNHPSGDPSPSPEDISVTRAIVQAGKLLDIEVLDHIIVAVGSFISLKERGLGFGD